MERNAEKLLKDNAMVQVKAQDEEITALKRELLLTQNCNQDVLCVDPVSLQATSPLSKWSSQPSGVFHNSVCSFKIWCVNVIVLNPRR